jgi:AcrR family transcriptional regulator
LLDAALTRLAQEGYGKLTASAVARAAGIAQPTFYVHFKDKADLVQALAQERIGKLRAALKEARARVIAGQTVEAIRETFRPPLEAYTEQPELFRLYMQETSQPGSPFAEHARKLRQELEGDLVDDLIALGAPASTVAERQRLTMIADGLIGLTETLGLGYLDGRYPDIESVLDVLARFALGAVSALPSS